MASKRVRFKIDVPCEVLQALRVFADKEKLSMTGAVCALMCDYFGLERNVRKPRELTKHREFIPVSQGNNKAERLILSCYNRGLSYRKIVDILAENNLTAKNGLVWNFHMILRFIKRTKKKYNASISGFVESLPTQTDSWSIL